MEPTKREEMTTGESSGTTNARSRRPKARDDPESIMHSNRSPGSFFWRASFLIASSLVDHWNSGMEQEIRMKEGGTKITHFLTDEFVMGLLI